jgi:hypothetical protein
VTFGAGGLAAVNAAGGVDSTTVLTDPVRVLDSRDPVNVGLAGPFASQVPQKLKVTGSIATTTGTKTVVPTGATGVLLNVTAVAPSADGFISIRPGDATGLPSTSSLNFTAGQIVPNAVLVALPTSGANAGKIDITYDAFGAAGPTTDILIDVVGYTNNSTLAALQAEIDAVEAANATQQTQINAVEATNATQQTQIDAKANAADVYTKSQIDASAASSVRAAGLVNAGGTVGCNNFACIGVWSATRTGTGSYTVSVPAATPSACLIPVVQVTPLSGFADPRIALWRSSSLNCPSGNVSFDVRTFSVSAAGVTTATDAAFSFSLQVKPGGLTTPALTNSSNETTCVVVGEGEVACE